MQNKIDKQALRKTILNADGLSSDDKSRLLALLSEQKYGLVWEDKTENAQEQLKESIPLLREVADKRLDRGGENAPNHILIEGDNLHALTALTYTHAGKIDVIYIDPPYNTGNKDFVYNDSFVDSEDSYRHSKWLSFMNRRLRIAKKLLSDKGVIFISIDDNEQANLKLLCDEVFGENNCRNIINTRRLDKNLSRQFIDKGIQSLAVGCEYVLVYSKTSEVDFYPIMREASDKRKNNGYWKGFWNAADRPTMRYELLGVLPETGQWKWESGKAKQAVENFERYQDALVDNPFLTLEEFWLRNGKTQKFIRRRNGNAKGKNMGVEHWVEPSEGILRTSNWSDIITTETHLNMELDFSSPKSLNLIKEIIKFGKNGKDATILDFFAGSGTTLHATMQLNAEDGGHRQCILVTNNENNICEEVTYERNKRVINGYTTPKGEDIAGLSGNNLRYYKMDMHMRDASHKEKINMAYSMTDTLCIMQNVYTEQETFGNLTLRDKAKWLRYFEQDGKRMLIIYKSDAIQRVVDEIVKMPKDDAPIKIYVFADGVCPYKEDFRDVHDKVELIAIPHAMYGALKHVLPEHEEKIIDVEPNNTEDHD